jgi:prepilin-type N-terminal cleavage/methylation domain-containing protein
MGKQQQKSGFTVIEVLIAIFVIAIGAAGVFALMGRTIADSSANNNKLVASYLSQEGVEIVRNIRDTNYLRIRQEVPGVAWDDNIILPGNDCATSCRADYNDTALIGVAGPQPPLLRDSTTSIFSYDSGSATQFTREIKATAVGPDKIEVEVTVSWSERGSAREAVAVTELYNWLRL